MSVFNIIIAISFLALSFIAVFLYLYLKHRREMGKRKIIETPSRSMAEAFSESRTWTFDPGPWSVPPERVHVWADVATHAALNEVAHELHIEETIAEICGDGFSRENEEQWKALASALGRTIQVGRWKDGQMLGLRVFEPQQAT